MPKLNTTKGINALRAMTPRTYTVLYALLLCIGFYCLDYFFRISPSVVLAPLIEQYHTNSLGMGLLASSFYLGYVVFQIPGGWLLDRFEPKWPLVFIITLCTLAFILFIYASSFSLGLVLRFIIGATSALSFISVLYIARHYCPPKWFSVISGVTIAAGTVCASFIQMLNTYLMQWFSWHTVLTSFSLWGLIIVLLLLPLSAKHFKKSPEVILKSAPPAKRPWLIELYHTLNNGKLLLNGLIGGLFYLPTSVLTAVWGVSFLTLQYQLSEPQASSTIFFIFLGWAVGAPLVGLAGAKWSQSRSLTVFPALCAGLSACFLLYGQPILNLEGLFLIAFLFGFFSSAQVNVWKNFHQLCPHHLTGIGIAGTNMLIMAVITIGHPIIGYLINQGANSQVPLTLHAYLVGLQWLPWLFVVVAALSLLLPLKRVKA